MTDLLSKYNTHRSNLDSIGYCQGRPEMHRLSAAVRKQHADALHNAVSTVQARLRA